MKIFLFIIFLLTSCNSISKDINSKKNISTKKIESINYFKWKNRILIIRENNTTKKINKFSKQFNERDILIIKIKDKKSYINDNLMPEKFYKTIDKKIKNINKSFTCILIGKDGKIKKTYFKDIDINEIFKKVDSMPMRMRELKKIN